LLKTKEVRDGLNACRKVAKKANANFFYASQVLQISRKEFFYAAYATMRIIDDLVDENFLKLDIDKQDELMQDFSTSLSRWLQQVLSLEIIEGPLSSGIIHALRYTVGRSDLTEAVWKDLADSLLTDIRRVDMNSWDDFLIYCKGATVAPASIYIYLLSANYSNEKGFVYKLSKGLDYYARDLAIYCYIVHIIRDLTKDAFNSPRLITIPNELLFKAGLSRQTLFSSLQDKDPAIVNLANELILRAKPFHYNGHKALSELNGKLGLSEKTALNRLIGIYDKLYEVAEKDVGLLIERGQGLEKEFRI